MTPYHFHPAHNLVLQLSGETALTVFPAGDAMFAPDVLQWRAVNPLRPKSHEVVIAVEAAGVNNADIMQRRGAYPVPPDAPKILGLECAGHITSIGDDVTLMAGYANSPLLALSNISR